MEIQQQQDFTEDSKVNDGPIGGSGTELDLDQNVPQDTVLFDKNPRIDYPLRIDPPFSMKVPERDLRTQLFLQKCGFHWTKTVRVRAEDFYWMFLNQTRKR